MWLQCKGTHFTPLPQFASSSSPFFLTYWRATARLPRSFPWRRADQRQACANRAAWANISDSACYVCLRAYGSPCAGWKTLLQPMSAQTKATLAGLYLGWHHSTHWPGKRKKKSVEQRGGVLAGLCSGNTAETKKARGVGGRRWGEAVLLVPRRRGKKHQDKPWNLLNNTRQQRPWLPTVIYCTRRVNTPANNGVNNERHWHR